MELSSGVKMLSAVFGIFTFCYVSRAIYDLVAGVDLQFKNIFTGTTFPVIWDGLPIFLMFAYHMQNSKKIKEQKRQKIFDMQYEVTNNSQVDLTN